MEARRVGESWQYLCVWSDADEPTWLDESELIEGGGDIHAWMEEARAEMEYREEAVREQGPSPEGVEPTVVPVGELLQGNGVPMPPSLAEDELRRQVAILGPFKHEQFLSTSTGRQVKRYRLLRKRKGGALGEHDHLVWVEFDDVTDEERSRTRRYMYDNDISQFMLSPLYTLFGVDLLGFAAPISLLVGTG